MINKAHLQLESRAQIYFNKVTNWLNDRNELQDTEQKREYLDSLNLEKIILFPVHNSNISSLLDSLPVYRQMDVSFIASQVNIEKIDQTIKSLERKIKYRNVKNVRIVELPQLQSDLLFQQAKLDNERQLLKPFIEFKDYMLELYKDFISKNGYELLEEFTTRTCPYCNRNYTFSINTNTRKTRPEFDHFYPKSQFPLLALSFYNLIPSCHTCNHLKGEKTVGVNPYNRGFDLNTKFVARTKCHKKEKINLSNINTTLDFELKLESICDKEKMNIDIFALNDLYNEHKDYIQEIFDKTQSYNDTALKSLYDSFQSPIQTQAGVYDFVWGRYLEDAEHEKRPLSKLTKDILDQLDIKRR